MKYWTSQHVWGNSAGAIQKLRDRVARGYDIPLADVLEWDLQVDDDLNLTICDGLIILTESSEVDYKYIRALKTLYTGA